MKPIFPKPTVSFITRSYLDQCLIRVKPSTRSTYAVILQKHILPAYANRRIGSLTAGELNAFLAAKSSDSHRLKNTTVCGIATVLRALLAHAAALGYHTVPASAVKMPRKTQCETSVFTREEQDRLKRYCEICPGRESSGLLLSLYAGLRIGEVCGLRWSDLSLDAGILSVSRTVQRIAAADPAAGNRTALLIDTPKSRSAIRVIPLPGFVAAALKACRSRENTADDAFLLSGDSTRPMEPRVWQKHYKCLLSAAGVEYRKYHTLRHSFATHCAELGFDPKTLSEILGHADVGITYKVYVHPSITAKRKLMENWVNDQEKPPPIIRERLFEWLDGSYFSALLSTTSFSSLLKSS